MKIASEIAIGVAHGDAVRGPVMTTPQVPGVSSGHVSPDSEFLARHLPSGDRRDDRGGCCWGPEAAAISADSETRLSRSDRRVHQQSQEACAAGPARSPRDANDNMDGTHVRIAIRCWRSYWFDSARAGESSAFGGGAVSAREGSVGPLNRGRYYTGTYLGGKNDFRVCRKNPKSSDQLMPQARMFGQD